VAGIILLTNMQTFLETVGVSGTPATVIYPLIAAVSLAALAWAIFFTRQEDEPQVVREDDPAVALEARIDRLAFDGARRNTPEEIDGRRADGRGGVKHPDSRVHAPESSGGEQANLPKRRREEVRRIHLLGGRVNTPLDTWRNRGYPNSVILFTRVVEMPWIPRPLRRTVPGRPSPWASGRRSGSG
jgi:hypothetical protein